MAVKISLEALIKKRADMGVEIIAAAKRAMLSAAHRLQVKVQDQTREAPPASMGPMRGAYTGAVDTGNYLRSWKVKPTDLGATLYNIAPYAGVIEWGRRAGRRAPPVQILATWVQRKLGLSRKEAQSAAFAISKAIAKRGLRARKVLRTTTTKYARAFVREEIKRELDNVLKGAAK